MWDTEDGVDANTPLRERTNVWYEKYRPRTVDEVVLPEEVKARIKSYLGNGGFNLPHLGLFSRTPGTGKSSLAKAILWETGAEALFINASLDKGIDTLRTKVQRFAAQSPMRDAVKIVVMDEFDYFSREGQAAFRGFIDEFGGNVRFIFTGNYKENVIEPLLDRLEIYDFNQFEQKDMVKPMFQRLKFILEAEGVEYELEDLKTIIKMNYPRMRKMIGVMAASIQGNKLVPSFQKDSEQLILLASYIKARDFEKALKQCYQMTLSDYIFGYFGENLDLICRTPEAKINACILLARYQHTSQTAKDKNLNLAACCAELIKL